MGELSAIIGMLSAMDWNDCPQSQESATSSERTPLARTFARSIGIENDPRYDKKKAEYLLKSFVELHPHAIGEKVRIMVETHWAFRASIRVAALRHVFLPRVRSGSKA
jgi:hypothetical protein